MKTEQKCAMNIRGFPLSLLRKCKAKANLDGKTLAEFVAEILKEATKDIPDPKKPH